MSREFDLESLRFDADGLIPAIAQDDESGEVLMLAWMNRTALQRTLKSGRVDRDCILMRVRQIGPACHTNRPSCFFTAVRDGQEVILSAPVE